MLTSGKAQFLDASTAWPETPKDLMGLPWRVAFALQDDGAASVAEMRVIERVVDDIVDAYGDITPPDKVLAVLERLHAEYAEAKGDSWWLRSAIVWHKPSPMPESVRDRPTSAYEMIFLLAKSGAPTYWTHKHRAGSRTKPVQEYEEVTNTDGTVTRAPLWRGHDYFYDADTIRTAAKDPADDCRRHSCDKPPATCLRRTQCVTDLDHAPIRSTGTPADTLASTTAWTP